MPRHTKRSACARALVLVAFAFTCCAAAGRPDLVPMPKIYRQTSGLFALNDRTIYIAPDNRQCRIAANEIAKRIVEKGGKPGAIAPAKDPSGAGIYILPRENPVAAALAASLPFRLTALDPGPQGYVIHTARSRLIVIGGDSVGALYGAMTLRQMIQPGRGQAVVAAADVYDRPDYLFRGKTHFRKSIRGWGVGERDPMPAYKSGLDWMMRFKLNLVNGIRLSDPRVTIPATKKFVKEFNSYAVERGIYPIIWLGTNVANRLYDKGKEFDNWDCVSSSFKGGRCYCWSRDGLATKNITRWADLMRECSFRMLFLHPKDGGGITDPEIWSKRCPRCRKRFGDRRWQASVHQFNLWARIMESRAPGVIISSPIYPYVASYSSYERFPGVSKEVWRKNSVDYWRNTHAGMNPAIVPMTWASQRSLMDKYRARFNGRPIAIYAHSFVPLGYFGTWHRNTKTNFYGHPGDVFYVAAAGQGLDRWMTNICAGEFAWNTLAPGHEAFTGLYYDADKDHTGPDVIMKEWLPRACRAFFGRQVGDRIVPVYQAGVQPLYIMTPAKAIAYANKPRRKPLAAVDPTKKAEQTIGKSVAPDIVDSPERMAFQVAATSKAIDALESALPYLKTLDKCRRKTVMYHYRRQPIWRMVARARHARYVAAALQRQGKSGAAAIEAGLRTFDSDLARARKVFEDTKSERDLARRSPFSRKSREIRPRPEEIRKRLVAQLASEKVVLKPRPPGKVIMVGIHKGLGQNGLKAFLDRFANVKAEIIASLSLVVLDKYDCLFVLQTKSADRGDYFHNLPIYVRQGGRGVLFQHDMCGRGGRCAFGNRTPFPDVCSGTSGREDAVAVIVKTEHPVMPGLKKGQRLEHMYYDHLFPAAGKRGKVVAIGGKGRPIVIVGESGRGKVVFDGNVNLTRHDRDELLTGFNAILARGAVEWFTGVKLRKR